MKPHRHLPRLAREAYHGRVWVHWTLCMQDRREGWLSNLHHAQLRECMLHALARYNLAAAVYVLMPDHAHFLWGGLQEEADQWRGMRFLRRHWNRLLSPLDCCLQHQGYDHVLRDAEAERGAFERTAAYILENPVRAGLVGEGERYPFGGCLVPGVPDLHPSDPGYWDHLWRAVHP